MCPGCPVVTMAMKPLGPVGCTVVLPKIQVVTLSTMDTLLTWELFSNIVMLLELGCFRTIYFIIAELF